MTRSWLAVALLAAAAFAAGESDSAGAQKGWLGVYTESLSKPMMVALNVEHGVLVTEVAEESPAASAGIAMGDLILSVDGVSVESPSDLRRAVRERPGRKVDIGIRRKGKEQRASATLESRQAAEQPSEYEWQGAPLEALREARKAIRELKPGTEKQVEIYRGSMESLRKEVEELKHELDQLREQVQKRERDK